MADLICCGAINWDINLFMERLPRSGEEVSVREIQRVSGGTAANVAVAGARILGPGSVSLLGALGVDEIAEEQIGILRDEGVDTSGILRVSGEESGQAYITIGEEGENEIHTYFGANLMLTADSLEDSARARLLEGSRVAVIMDPPLEVAESLSMRCMENGVTVIWDPGVYADRGIDALIPTLTNTDYFVLNHLEFENLLGTSIPHEVARLLNDRIRGLKAIIKRGREGCTMTQGSFGATIHVDAVPLEQLGMEVVNTVGCGDAFIGAFAASKVQGMDDIDALHRGCAAGSFKATRKETRGGPTAEELEELMDEWSQL